jgi:hypothetical protein
MNNDPKNVSGAQFQMPADQFKVRSASAGLQFATQELQPGIGCYIGVDDRLMVSFMFDLNNNQPVVNVRVLRDDGTIIPFTFTPPVTAARTLQQTIFNLCEGFILSCSIMAISPTNAANIAWGSCAIVRAPGTTLSQYELLCAGYLSNVFPVGYPLSVPQRSIEGPGQPRSFAITTPGAGADWSFTVPAGMRLRVIAISGTLVTAVAVANRNVDLVLDDGVTVYAEIPSGASQIASLTNDYSWIDSGPPGTIFDNQVVLPLPANYIVPPNHRIRSETTGIQGADQWSNLNMLAIEWLEVG